MNKGFLIVRSASVCLSGTFRSLIDEFDSEVSYIIPISSAVWVAWLEKKKSMKDPRSHDGRAKWLAVLESTRMTPYTSFLQLHSQVVSSQDSMAAGYPVQMQLAS